MAEKVLSVKGMNDLLPNLSYQWLWLETELVKWLTQYGYENIRTPILESTALFRRSIGEVTDIVEKEMYSFVDSLNNDQLTMRPEGTAGVIRAVVEHNLLYNNNQKLWYMGPMFRHERPQKGRYRQFHQLGVEALGFQGPDIDCEIILMLQDLWQRLGLNEVELHINCLGNSQERAAHRLALIDYFMQHQDKLDSDSKRRLHSNPLRILDTKNPALEAIVIAAPKLADFLANESLTHYQSWKNGLTALGIKYIENPRLVRGLDYYNLSVFEWVSADLGAQSTICGGGRYDPLIAELGGKDDYAIGYAIGIERLLLSLGAQHKIPAKKNVDIYIINQGAGASVLAFKLATDLRNIGYNVIQHLGGGAFKAQFKKAAQANAYISLVIGENEVLQEQVVVKLMTEQTQELVALSQLVDYLHQIFKV